MKFEESLKSGIFADLDRLARLLGVDKIEFIEEKSFADPLNTMCKFIAYKDTYRKALMLTSKAFDIDEDLILQQLRNLTKSLISEAMLDSMTATSDGMSLTTGLPKDEIRELLKKKLFAAGISKIEIERTAKFVKINVYTAKPGLVIGKGGNLAEELKAELEKMINKTVYFHLKI